MELGRLLLSQRRERLLFQVSLLSSVRLGVAAATLQKGQGKAEFSAQSVPKRSDGRTDFKKAFSLARTEEGFTVKSGEYVQKVNLKMQIGVWWNS